MFKMQHGISLKCSVNWARLSKSSISSSSLTFSPAWTVTVVLVAASLCEVSCCGGWNGEVMLEPPVAAAVGTFVFRGVVVTPFPCTI